MVRPSPNALRDAVSISQSYASMILNGERTPSRPLAIRIFRATGWKPTNIENLTDEQISMLETIEAAA